MHLYEESLLVVRREVLEVYLTPTVIPLRWKSISIPYVVGAAIFSSTNSLRLCTTSNDGIMVYNVILDIKQSNLSLDLLWHHEPTPDVSSPLPAMVTFSPCWGVSGSLVSWMTIDHNDESDFSKFSIERLPSHSTDEKLPIFNWFDNDMPIQCAIGVHDFDEVKGLAIFGNAFGELCLYDFAGSRPSTFEGCYKYQLEIRPHTREELLPTVRTV